MTSVTKEPATQSSRAAHLAFGATAILAWFGMALNLILSALGTYPSLQTVPTLLGFNDPGIAGLPGRVFDFFTYFTIISNILVAIVMTMLWRNPNRMGVIFRTIFLDALLMISVTGLIYGVILAGGSKLQGLEVVTNTVEHYLVPLAAIITFILYGPRGRIRIGTIFAALILPIGWAVFALVRGAIINAYPYSFLDVSNLGYGTVFVNIFGIAVFGVVIGFILWAIDRLILRMQRDR
jgi:hypothetical protein